MAEIHYWLYNKIKFNEGLIESILKLAESKNYNIKETINESYLKYEAPITNNLILKEQIENDKANEWLQDRIKSVENRLAYVVTELLKNNVIEKEEIGKIFYENGKEKVKEYKLRDALPQDLFNLIFDYIIEGMPNDKSTEIIENEEKIFSWKTTKDFHKVYWDKVNGDVTNFHYLRDSWIEGFINSGRTKYNYNRTENIHTIKRI